MSLLGGAHERLFCNSEAAFIKFKIVYAFIWSVSKTSDNQLRYSCFLLKRTLNCGVELCDQKSRFSYLVSRPRSLRGIWLVRGYMIFTNISFVCGGPGQGSGTHADKYLCVICSLKILIFERRLQKNGQLARNTDTYCFLLSGIQSSCFHYNNLSVHRRRWLSNYKKFVFAKRVLPPFSVIYWRLIIFVYRIYWTVDPPCW